MLSGKVPFQVRSSANTADAIMKQIKSGLFSLQGPEWNEVSAAAKKLIKGTNGKVIFRTPNMFAVITLKFMQKGLSIEKFVQKMLMEWQTV